MISKKDMANMLRFLSIDAIEKANSGHPGMPLGMADIAQVLWCDFLSHNPSNPSWYNRDRFVLSNGHGSMLLYSLLHLTGYDLSLDEIKNFRQLHSKTPGHPEVGITPGVEATTGPLGQGIANAVGMAIGQKILSATYNRESFPIIDHYTYAFVGDGCLMEGVSHEVSSLAGTMNLSKLIVIWDDNGISIDGEVAAWFDEDVAKRYESYGWHVITDIDGHDHAAIAAAIAEAKSNTEAPSLICAKTTIGFGVDALAGTAKAHGAPLGKENIKSIRAKLNWEHAEFVVPKEMTAAWDQRGQGQSRENAWLELLEGYKAEHPELYHELLGRLNNTTPIELDSDYNTWLHELQSASSSMATRGASQKCLEFFTSKLKVLTGGSADLSCSNLTVTTNTISTSDTWDNANYIYYGVREFGMFAIANGLALHGGFIPFVSTFVTFVDYGRNALRLAALAKTRVIYVLTHDSIGLGEDGPTHQPIEHAAMLRATPGVNVWRPCDEVETAVAWKMALGYDGPSCLLLSRQKLPAQNRTNQVLLDVAKGGYLLRYPPNIEAIIIATGSEVGIAMQAAAELEKQGVNIAVVSMPSVEIFLQQSQEYKDIVLPPAINKRLVLESLSSHGWHRFIDNHGLVHGLDEYGHSGKAEALFEFFGFTVPNVVAMVKGLFEPSKNINKEENYAN
jgi:transketolase